MLRRAAASNLFRAPNMAGSLAIAAPHTMAAWSRFASTKSSSAVRASTLMNASAPSWVTAATSGACIGTKTASTTDVVSPLISQSQMCHLGSKPTGMCLARIGNTRGGSDMSSYQSGNSSPMNFGGSSGSGDNSDPLPPHVRQHLIRVYNLLALSVACAACGSGLMIFTGLGKAIPFWLPMVAGFVPLLWLNFKPPASSQARTALLLTFALIEGMALAPVVKMSAAAGVLGSALVLTAAVFGGFSAASFLAPRASLIALQGPMFGMLMGMMAISLLNMFYPTAFAHSLILYGGLALFSVFIAVDTQAMIERARCGVSDPAQDALGMFLNVVNIFVRIAQILRSMGE